MVMELNNKVTDPEVLRELSRQGIDGADVEFFKDYGARHEGKSPYAKTYRHLKSERRFLVVSALPRVTSAGDMICGVSHNATTVGFEQKQAKRYETSTNIFSGSVEDKRVYLSCLNDQPWGARSGAEVTWEPRLFLDGIEQTGSAPSLLSEDPINSNYHNNVIQWDYPACKRRLRVIEGRAIERWLFDTKPGGEIRIKHGFAGNFTPRLGFGVDAEGNPINVRVIDDEEIVNPEDLVGAVFPIEIGASQTFYPDAAPGVSSCDGRAFVRYVELSYAALMLAAGNNGDAGGIEANPGEIVSHPNVDKWNRYMRCLYLFDTSVLPNNAIITAVTQSHYLYDKHYALPAPVLWGLNVFSSNPASNTDIVAADYQSLGTTPFSTEIRWGLFQLNQYTDWPFNAAGIASVSKTGVSKYGLRLDYWDVQGHEPAWAGGQSGYVRAYFTEKGSGYQPKLVVTYDLPKPGTASLASKMIAGKLI